VRNARAGVEPSVGRESRIDQDGIPPQLLAKLDGDFALLSLYEIMPFLGSIARHATGVEFLQKRLPEASSELQSMICGAALPEVVALSADQTGHKVVLLLLDVSTAELRKVIAETLSLHVLPLSLNPYGCHIIQKALQVVSVESRKQLISGLKGGIGECITSRNGNHVVQMCIEQMPAPSLAFIADAVKEVGAATASTHVCACRVVMRLLEHMHGDQVQGLLRQIFESVPKLVLDRYGNYVVQHIMEHGSIADRQAVMSKILELDLLTLCRNKYAHNVVIKIIQISCSPLYRVSLSSKRLELITLFMQGSDGVLPPAVRLASHRLGIAVVQHLMDSLEDHELARLTCTLREAVTELKQVPHAEALVRKLLAEV
jgi:pumilio RNA-binding family